MADPHTLAKSAGTQSESRKLADLRALLDVSRQLGGGDDLLTLLHTIETAALQGVPGRIVALLYRSRWGGRPHAAGEVRALGEELDQLDRALAVSSETRTSGAEKRS